MSEIVARELALNEAVVLWDEAEKYLWDAVNEADKETFLRNLKAKVFSGMTQLWKIEDEAKDTVAFALTIIYTPDGITRTAQIYMAGARDLKLFLSQMPQFESWAISKDIDYLQVIGRKGWERVLKPFGFTHDHTSLIKRVDRKLH